MNEEMKQLSAEEQKFSDNFITCPHCGSKLCYHQSTEDGVEAMTCMACGFTTSTLMKSGSDTEKAVSAKYPTLYKNLRFVDPLGFVWYPAVITVPGAGMVYIDGSNNADWQWTARPMRRLSRRERRRGEHKGQEYVAVPERTQKHGQEGGFIKACAAINLFGQNEN